MQILSFAFLFINFLPVCFYSQITTNNTCKNTPKLNSYYLSSRVKKKSDRGKPFIFENKVVVVDNKKRLSKEEKQLLVQRLENEITDSARIYAVDKFFFFQTHKHISTINLTQIENSARNMRNSLLHMGYYFASVSYCLDTVVKYKNTKKQQIRGYVTYTATLDKPIVVDEVYFRARNKEIQKLWLDNRKYSLFVKDTPVSKQIIFDEMARVANLMRRNGYYKFGIDRLKVVGDTTAASLTTVMSIDEQILLAEEEAVKRKEKPTMDLTLLLLNPNDTVLNTPYTVRNVYVKDRLGNVILENNKPTSAITTINKNLLTNKILFKPGKLYSQDDESATFSNLLATGLYSLINIDTANAENGQFDIEIKLNDYKRVTIEGSLSTTIGKGFAAILVNNTPVSRLNNLLTFGVNGKYINRNFFNSGWLFSAQPRFQADYLLEAKTNIFDKDRISAFLISLDVNSSTKRLSNAYNFINNFLSAGNANSKQGAFNLNKLDWQNPSTFINGRLAINKRSFLIRFFTSDLNAGFSGFSNKLKGNLTLRLVNFENTVASDTTSLWNSVLAAQPFLRFAYNTATVLGTQINFNKEYFKRRKTKDRKYLLIANFEQSGSFITSSLLKPIVKKLFDGDIRRFVKFDIEWRKTQAINRQKGSESVLRLFAGVGFTFDKEFKTMPFFKQYFGGGNNSMRAWPIKSLGIGGQPFANTTGNNNFFDRTGDLKFEANYERRHNLFNITDGVMLKGALFVDAGNVWNLRRISSTNSDISVFSPSRLFTQMAVASGYGFRVDFGNFLARIDIGFRLKKPDAFDPVRVNNPFKPFTIGEIPRYFFGRGNNNQYRNWRNENMNIALDLALPF